MKNSEWLRRFIEKNGVNARLIKTGKVSTVSEAAREMKCSRDQIIKSVVLVTESGKGVVAVVDGVSRVSIEKVERIVGEKVRIAGKNEVEELTGFQAGGVAPFGHECLVIIDSEVFRNSLVYGGGGDEYHLVEISPDEIVRANSGRVLSGDISI